jgi:hypothetical protein
VRVFNLLNKAGNFETAPIGDGRDGRRTFGLWEAMHGPQPGDLVLKWAVHKRGKCVFIIETVDPDPFVGSDWNKFWTGTMRDVNRNNLWTEEIHAALRSAHPQLYEAAAS